jgi:hypothetical protein
MFDRRRAVSAAVRRRRRNSGRVESRRRRHLSGIATELAKIEARLVWCGHEDQRRHGVAELFLVSMPPGSSSTPSNNTTPWKPHSQRSHLVAASGYGNHLVHRILYSFMAPRGTCTEARASNRNFEAQSAPLTVEADADALVVVDVLRQANARVVRGHRGTLAEPVWRICGDCVSVCSPWWLGHSRPCVAVRPRSKGTLGADVAELVDALPRENGAPLASLPGPDDKRS